MPAGLAGGDVEHGHVERADRRALDDRVAGALHPRLTPATAASWDRPRSAGAAGTRKAATAAASERAKRMEAASLGGNRTNRRHVRPKAHLRVRGQA